MTVKWQEPEVSIRGPKGKWKAIVAELDERPGEWALIGEDVSHSIRTYLTSNFPSYEFTTRGVKNSRAAELYGRRAV